MSSETHSTDSTSSLQAGSGQARQCQNCKQNFVIEPDDFAFYERIKVPAPTWCPKCRLIRRIVWLNSLNLFKRKCDAPGHEEEIISKYSPQSNRKVYDEKYWWSDAWDPFSYGKEYDFSRSFLSQFGELMENVPQKNLDNVNSVNCGFCASAVECKDCYLCIGSYKSERCLYGDTVTMSKNCVDNYFIVGSELVYKSIDCSKCFMVSFASFCTDCMYSSFIYDCKNCSYCFGCAGLRNKKYCIFNEQYTKEEYEKKIREFYPTNGILLKKTLEIFGELLLKIPRKYALITHSVNCTGDVIENSKDCKSCFWITGGAENCKLAVCGGFGLKDSRDVYSGGGQSEMLYEVVTSGLGCKNISFSGRIQQSMDIKYSIDCYGSSNLFGCVGLRSKSYCILNKQYTKEEYEAFVPKIIEHMSQNPYVDKVGREYRYGEFFPMELSHFPYNGSTAQEHFPKTKEEAEKAGYVWRQEIEKDYIPSKKSEDVLIDISDIPDSITEEIIECAHKGECNDICVKAFRITPDELQFHRKMNIVLPVLCPNCRHMEFIRQRNPLKLWHRQCMCNKPGHSHKSRCPNEFETSYSPKRKEVVYCESCYNAEVV